MKTTRFAGLSTAWAVAVALSMSAAPLRAQTGPDAKANTKNGTQDDTKIQQEVQKSLKGSRFKDVQVSAQNGMVKLSGTVPVFEDKEDADKKAHHAKSVTAVENDIQVAQLEVPDAALQARIEKQLAYDRVGYGNAFNAITVSVRDGVATLGGHALGPVAAQSAVSLVSNTPGVRDVVDEIQVDPLSPFDDQTRLAVARAVYGFASLNKYALDPAAPIRITVVNGHVILSGVVDSQADKDAAGIRANGVAGVFSVTNDLQVANSGSERR